MRLVPKAQTFALMIFNLSSLPIFSGFPGSFRYPVNFAPPWVGLPSWLQITCTVNHESTDNVILDIDTCRGLEHWVPNLWLCLGRS